MKNPTGQELRESAEQVYILPSLEFISSLAHDITYTIQSPYPTINNSKCRIRVNKSWDAEIRAGSPKGGLGYQPADFQHDGYGFKKPFMLVDESTVFAIPEGLGNHNINFSNGTDFTSGTFRELLSLHGITSHFMRFIFKMDDISFTPSDYYVTKPYKTEEVFFAGQLMRLEYGGNTLRSFRYRHNEDHYFFIDCLNPTTFEDAKLLVKTFVAVNGVCSGQLVRGKCIILHASHPNFTTINHFSYIKFNKSKRGFSVLNPVSAGQLISGLAKDLKAMSEEALGAICSLAFKESVFYRALTIISESHSTPIEVCTATYCVALETLRNYILNEEHGYLAPIKEKVVAKEIRKQFLNILDARSDDDYNDKASVVKKVNNLNQHGNTEGFYKIFELLNIKLSAEDIDALKKRNDFLHGRIPFDSGHEQESIELVKILYRIHLLLCSIVFRLGDYQGYYVNNLRFKYPQFEEEPVFRAFGFQPDLTYP